MDLDPHTLQAILQRIYQQMRCPQCGKKVPVDFSSLRVLSGDNLLLQLKCSECDAHIVLQANMQGVENVSAPPYEENNLANISSNFDIKKDEIEILKNALEKSGGSFESIFKDIDSNSDVDSSSDNPQISSPDTDIA